MTAEESGIRPTHGSAAFWKLHGDLQELFSSEPYSMDGMTLLTNPLSAARRFNEWAESLRNFNPLFEENAEVFLRLIEAAHNYRNRWVTAQENYALAEIHELDTGEAVRAARERDLLWETRIRLAPAALALIATGSLTGASLLENQAATMVASTCALLVAAATGCRIPFLRKYKAGHNVLYEREGASLIALKHQNQGVFECRHFDVPSVGDERSDKSFTPRELHQNLDFHVRELTPWLETALKATQKTLLMFRVMEHLHRIEIKEKRAFELSVVFLLFGLINPIFVTAFGPIFEFSVPIQMPWAG